MKKLVKLINDERKINTILSQTAETCVSGARDVCLAIDHAKCSLYAYDFCSKKDYAGCSEGADDTCSIDTDACIGPGVEDND